MKNDLNLVYLLGNLDEKKCISICKSIIKITNLDFEVRYDVCYIKEAFVYDKKIYIEFFDKGIKIFYDYDNRYIFESVSLIVELLLKNYDLSFYNATHAAYDETKMFFSLSPYQIEDADKKVLINQKFRLISRTLMDIDNRIKEQGITDVVYPIDFDADLLEKYKYKVRFKRAKEIVSPFLKSFKKISLDNIDESI